MCGIRGIWEISSLQFYCETKKNRSKNKFLLLKKLKTKNKKIGCTKQCSIESDALIVKAQINVLQIAPSNVK